jgi:chromosome segregation ATPase
MKPLRKTQRSPAEQLTLPGTLLEPKPFTIEDKLAYARGLIQERDEEAEALRQQLRATEAQFQETQTRLRAQLDEAQDQLHDTRMAQLAAVKGRLEADHALREAKGKILMLETLCSNLHALLRHPSPDAPPADQAWLVKELTRLLSVCHPDKWQGAAVAEELTKEVLKVRQRLQGTGAGRKGARR